MASSVEEAIPHQCGTREETGTLFLCGKGASFLLGRALLQAVCYSVSCADPCPPRVGRKEILEYTELGTALNLGFVMTSVLGLTEFCSLDLPLSQDDYYYFLF